MAEEQSEADARKARRIAQILAQVRGVHPAAQLAATNVAKASTPDKPRRLSKAERRKVRKEQQS